MSKNIDRILDSFFVLFVFLFFPILTIPAFAQAPPVEHTITANATVADYIRLVSAPASVDLDITEPGQTDVTTADIVIESTCNVIVSFSVSGDLAGTKFDIYGNPTGSQTLATGFGVSFSNVNDVSEAPLPSGSSATALNNYTPILGYGTNLTVHLEIRATENGNQGGDFSIPIGVTVASANI